MAASLFDLNDPFNPHIMSYKSTIYANMAYKKNRFIVQSKYKCANEESCPICIDSMNNKSIIYTPCKHKFHYKCFFDMLSVGHLTSSKCPLCRHDLLFALIKLHLGIFKVNVITYNFIILDDTDGRSADSASIISDDTDTDAESTDADAEGTDAEGADAEGADAESTDVESTEADAESTDVESIISEDTEGADTDAGGTHAEGTHAHADADAGGAHTDAEGTHTHAHT